MLAEGFLDPDFYTAVIQKYFMNGACFTEIPVEIVHGAKTEKGSTTSRLGYEKTDLIFKQCFLPIISEALKQGIGRCHTPVAISLQWRHNGRDSVSNHQPHDCLLNRLFGRRSKKTSKLRVTGLCAGNSPGTGEFPAPMARNAENFSIWWRHHVEIRTLWFSYTNGFMWIQLRAWPTMCPMMHWEYPESPWHMYTQLLSSWWWGWH